MSRHNTRARTVKHDAQAHDDTTVRTNSSNVYGHVAPTCTPTAPYGYQLGASANALAKTAQTATTGRQESANSKVVVQCYAESNSVSSNPLPRRTITEDRAYPYSYLKGSPVPIHLKGRICIADGCDTIIASDNPRPICSPCDTECYAIEYALSTDEGGDVSDVLKQTIADANIELPKRDAE